jgi:Spy/CpxP family protein refolding chaperone
MNHAIKAAVLSACALFLVAGSKAFSSPIDFRGGGFGPGDQLMQLVKKANLTPQQQDQIQTIRASAKSQQKSLMQQWSALHTQIADKLLATSTPAMADFSSLTQQMNQVHAQQVTLALQTALQIRAVLTPAQVTHVAQIYTQLNNLSAQRRAVLQDDDTLDVPATTVPTTNVPAPVEMEGR